MIARSLSRKLWRFCSEQIRSGYHLQRGRASICCDAVQERGIPMHIDWIIANKGWLLRLFNWVIGTCQNRRSQTQKSGDCSVKTQIGRQIQKGGDNSTYIQAGNIFVVGEDVLKKLPEQHSADLKHAQEPDSQHASLAQPGSAHAVDNLPPCARGKPLTAA